MAAGLLADPRRHIEERRRALAATGNERGARLQAELEAAWDRQPILAERLVPLAQRDLHVCVKL